MVVRIYETLSRDQLDAAITVRKELIAEIEARMPYADGGAYSQDKDRIADTRRDIVALEQCKRKLGEDHD